ncbi:jhy protein homolog isoform X2 [Dendropsophus ebraccatus]|uniref:jhy protein homolog isoform X2 n=1 Tax=Dendropsophus ebraccatus TaxID=150705 RepID=UPI0038315886
MESDNAMRSLHGSVYKGGDPDLGLSSDSLEDSDTDSLYEERRYQSELQERIHSNYDIIIPTKGDTEGIQAEVTSGGTEDVSHQEKEAKPCRPLEIRRSYSELRYDPDWRKHQNQDQEEEEEYLDVLTPDELTPDPPEGRDSADSPPFWKTLTDVNKRITKTTKPESDGSSRGPKNKKTATAQQETSKKDIIEKNKVTLGVSKEKTKSYLHMHKKKVEESKSGQQNEKSDVQPTEKALHLEKEAIDESELSGSHIHKNRPKTLYMAGALPDVKASQWDAMAVYSGEFDSEYLAIPSYPDRYRDSFMGPYSSPGHLQMHNEGMYYQIIRPPEMSYGQHIMETMEDISIQNKPEPHRIPYSTHNDVFIPGHVNSQTYAPIANGSSCEPEADASEASSNERTKPCPSGVRKTSEKYQKRLKSILNQEVKLGGLGPVHSVSEEKVRERTAKTAERIRQSDPRAESQQTDEASRNPSYAGGQEHEHKAKEPGICQESPSAAAST